MAGMNAKRGQDNRLIVSQDVGVNRVADKNVQLVRRSLVRLRIEPSENTNDENESD